MYSTIVMVMHVERGRHSFWMIQAFPKPKHDWAQRNETTPIFSPRCYGISFVLPGPSGFDSLIILLYSKTLMMVKGGEGWWRMVKDGEGWWRVLTLKHAMALWSPETLLGSSGYQLCHRCCHPGCGWIPPAHKNPLWRKLTQSSCMNEPAECYQVEYLPKWSGLNTFHWMPGLSHLLHPRNGSTVPALAWSTTDFAWMLKGYKRTPRLLRASIILLRIEKKWFAREEQFLHAVKNTMVFFAMSCCCFHVKCNVFLWCPGTDRLDFPVQV